MVQAEREEAMSAPDALIIIAAVMFASYGGYLIGKSVGDNDATKAWQRAEYWKNLYDKVTKEK